MENHNITQKALSDIESLKKTLTHLHRQNALGLESVDAHITLSSLMLTASGLLTGIESLTNGITADLIASASNPALQQEGLIQVGATLAILMGGAYAYLSVTSTEQKQALDSYTGRYFSYFQRLSGCSDLFVKFAGFALVILAGRPDWVAPLLMLYIGDVVFQGRLFTLPARLSPLLGVSCFVGGIGLFITGMVSVLWPLLAFSAIAAASVVQAMSAKSRMTREQ